MSIDILAAILGGAISLLAGGIASSDIIRHLIYRLLRIEDQPKNQSYSSRLAELTQSLMQSSRSVDEILAEFARVARDRETTIQKLEADLLNLEHREKQLQQRIKDLENVPLPVAEHFASLTASGEKRSAMRDYILFGAGVVLSTIIAILLNIAGLG